MDCHIKTLVFFDLETSSLIDWMPGQRPSYPDIIEISMIAVHRDSLLFTERSSSLPRVLHKLTLPVNTKRALSSYVTELTGLDNQHLDHAPNLSQTASTAVAAFLECLAPPVCLVAHNGDKFDFPIFLHHFQAVASMKSVISNLFCVDSLPIFQELDAIGVPHFTQSGLSEMNSGCCYVDKFTSFQESNECTPPRPRAAALREPSAGSHQRTPVGRSVNRFAAQRLFSSGETSQTEDEHCPLTTQATLIGSDSGRRIDALPLSQSSAFPGRSVLSQGNSSQKLSYKLSSVHSRLFGRMPQACHGAEVDAETLLRCARWYGHHFLELCDQRAAEMWLFAYLASDACV